jgi:hypothetical protein
MRASIGDEAVAKRPRKGVSAIADPSLGKVLAIEVGQAAPLKMTIAQDLDLQAPRGVDRVERPTLRMPVAECF